MYLPDTHNIYTHTQTSTYTVCRHQLFAVYVFCGLLASTRLVLDRLDLSSAHSNRKNTSQKTIIKTMRPGPGPARPVLLVVRTVHFAFVHDSLGAPLLGRDWVLQLLCCLLHCSNPCQKQKPYRQGFFHHFFFPRHTLWCAPRHFFYLRAQTCIANVQSTNFTLFALPWHWARRQIRKRLWQKRIQINNLKYI